MMTPFEELIFVKGQPMYLAYQIYDQSEQEYAPDGIVEIHFYDTDNPSSEVYKQEMIPANDGYYEAKIMPENLDSLKAETLHWYKVTVTDTIDGEQDVEHLSPLNVLY